jgi:DNA polymerase type B, organellar and viral
VTHDIFLRAHTTQSKKRRQRRPPGPPWPEYVLVFDTETTTDTQQRLTIGTFRRCRLVRNAYICVEEGLFYADDVGTQERRTLDRYIRDHDAAIGVKSFPPKRKLSLHTRSDFVEKRFWKSIRNGELVVAFNCPFDLGTLAVDWRAGRDGGWSLILSLRQSHKTGQLEPNPHRSRVRVTARNSKAAFISLTRPLNPEEWPDARFLDLHTLAAALYDRSYSLDGLCKLFKLLPKSKHEPTGRITVEEIDYCREDVRATTDVLNALKHEFDQHPLDLYPDQAFSPASMAKSYLDALGVVPPQEKFNVPDAVLGIAMEAYYGGRAECRIRRTEVPIVHTDFRSQYPTANALLGNWTVLTAKTVTFEDATEDVRALLARVTLDDSFTPALWRELSFFALVQPDDDIFPVRTVYNGQTQNIGVNRLRSDQPLWFAGPDVVASILLRDKVPHIEKAIRMVPHGTQEGLTPTNLRGMVAIDPQRHDFFRRVVEQRQRHKQSNKPLSDFLKTLANSGSYGSFVEVTPKAKTKPTPVNLFTGTAAKEVMSLVVEAAGRWYFPPIAALITASGRLLLAMLERCVADVGGTYLFCDTDSLCIVAAEHERLIPCEGGSHRLHGQDAIKALSRAQVCATADRFTTLNPFDRNLVPGSILKVEDLNFDAAGRPQHLSGVAISAKRYVLYKRAQRVLTLVDPKAHGLGYLYSPTEPKNEDEQPWSWEAWDWMLREVLSLPRTAPPWLDLPAMMRVVLSTPLILDRLNRQTRPFSFLFCPLIDPLVGYPIGADRKHFTLIARFTKRRDEWLRSSCINVYDGRAYQLALQQTAAHDKVIPQTFGHVLRMYPLHPEAKSLAPDGTPCKADTRGVLARALIVAGARHPVGKETDRRWEHGEDLSLKDFTLLDYGSTAKMVVAD